MNPSTFDIEGRAIGDGQRCFVIGEVALAHDGRLDTAHAFIDAIAAAGADAVKFQTHIAAAESTPAETFRVPVGTQDATRYDYWKRTEFTETQWRALAAHARARGLIFLSSPFSIEAVELLARVGMPAWKIPSGEIGNVPMIDRIAQAGRPVLLSTGMSPLAEIDAVVARLRGHRVPLLVLQATTAYPCPPEQTGLNLLQVFRQRYGCPVGLSDHSGTVAAGLAACALGADILEVHVTLDRRMSGPDVPASLTTEELRQLTAGVGRIAIMRTHPVDKDALAVTLEPMRRLFFKSIVAGVELAEGTVLERSHLAVKKPGTGIPPGDLEALVGKRVRRLVRKDEHLQWQDVA